MRWERYWQKQFETNDGRLWRLADSYIKHSQGDELVRLLNQGNDEFDAAVFDRVVRYAFDVFVSGAHYGASLRRDRYVRVDQLKLLSVLLRHYESVLGPFELLKRLLQRNSLLAEKLAESGIEESLFGHPQPYIAKSVQRVNEKLRWLKCVSVSLIVLSVFVMSALLFNSVVIGFVYGGFLSALVVNLPVLIISFFVLAMGIYGQNQLFSDLFYHYLEKEVDAETRGQQTVSPKGLSQRVSYEQASDSNVNVCEFDPSLFRSPVEKASDLYPMLDCNGKFNKSVLVVNVYQFKSFKYFDLDFMNTINEHRVISFFPSGRLNGYFRRIKGLAFEGFVVPDCLASLMDSLEKCYKFPLLNFDVHWLNQSYTYIESLFKSLYFTIEDNAISYSYKTKFEDERKVVQLSSSELIYHVLYEVGLTDVLKRYNLTELAKKYLTTRSSQDFEGMLDSIVSSQLTELAEEGSALPIELVNLYAKSGVLTPAVGKSL